MKLNVKGKKYTIKREPHENHGECDRDNRIITIDSGPDSAKLQRWTLVHELMHAYLAECHLGALLDEHIEDIICECAAEIDHEHHKLLNKFK